MSAKKVLDYSYTKRKENTVKADARVPQQVMQPHDPVPQDPQDQLDQMAHQALLVQRDYPEVLVLLDLKETVERQGQKVLMAPQVNLVLLDFLVEMV